MILLALSMLTALSQSHSDREIKGPDSSGCSVSTVQLCRDTNELSREIGFDRTIKSFLGKTATATVNYLYAGKLSYQVEDVLGGPPNNPVKLPDGGYLFTACRAHSCTEKGAISYDRKSQITMIAIVSYHCGKVSKTCSNDPFLDVYIHNNQQSESAQKYALDWAIKATASDASVFHTNPVRYPIIHTLG